MYKLVPISAALLLSLAAPSAALADPGNGKGGDKQERGNRGGEQSRGGDDNRGSGNGNGRGNGDDRRDERRAERPDVRGVEMARRDRNDDRNDDRGDDRRENRQDDRNDVRRTLERQVFQTRDGQPVVYFRRDDDRGLIAGCPPGLAKKDNGCLPPGQARKIARAAGADRYDWMWRGRDDAGRYEYRDGYLYRSNQQGSLTGWLPVLGGALSPGSAWPSQYQYQPAPDYYSSYFGLNQNQDYRYADGALYGVNPQTNTISQVAALLTGQNLGVGQRLPSGYDVYNVPYAYRDQYADNATSMYRYNDGYVYQADPKTQLITTVIQLLT